MKRIKYLDSIKFLAIFGVVSYHLNGVDFSSADLVKSSFTVFSIKTLMGLSSIAVPLFFMTNGAVLLNRDIDFRKHYKNTFRTLFIFWLYYICTVYILSVYLNKSLIINDLSNVLNTLFLNASHVDVSHMWFMFSYVGILLIYPFIHLVFNKCISSESGYKKVLILISVLIIFINLDSLHQVIRKIITFQTEISFSGITRLLPVDRGFLGMIVFVLIGGFLHRVYFIRERQPRLVISLVAFALFSILSTFMWIYISKVVPNFDQVVGTYVLWNNFFTASSLFVLVMALDMSNYTPPIVQYVSQKVALCTLEIYYWHWIVGILIVPLIFDSLQFDSILISYSVNLLKTLLMIFSISTICNFLRDVGTKRKLSGDVTP